MKRTFGAIAVLAVGLFTAVSANQDLLTLQKDDNQWAIPAKNYSATRYSTLKQITAVNVSKLRQVWSFSTGALRGHEGQPLVVGTTMYVHSAYPNHIYAIDMTKEGWPIKWKYTPVQNDRAVAVACCDLVHKGVNYAQGKIYMTTLDGQVIALDANTGKEVWKVRNADPTRGETQTMAGLIVKDKYIVGVSGGEFGIRGWIAAYALADGKQLWKAYSMGPDSDVKLAPDFNEANPHYGRFDQGTKDTVDQDGCPLGHLGEMHIPLERWVRGELDDGLGDRRGMVAHPLELVGHVVEGEQVTQVAGDRVLGGDRHRDEARDPALRLVDDRVAADDVHGQCRVVGDKRSARLADRRLDERAHAQDRVADEGLLTIECVPWRGAWSAARARGLMQEIVDLCVHLGPSGGVAHVLPQPKRPDT